MVHSAGGQSVGVGWEHWRHGERAGWCRCSQSLCPLVFPVLRHIAGQSVPVTTLVGFELKFMLTSVSDSFQVTASPFPLLHL